MHVGCSISMNSENREAQLVFKETWPGKIFAVVKFLIVSFFFMLPWQSSKSFWSGNWLSNILAQMGNIFY